MRRYGDFVQVRTCSSGPVSGPVSSPVSSPEQFIWRGRLYVVRVVLAHWVEGGSWWRRLGSTPVTGQMAADQAADSSADSSAETNARVSGERHLWRVEASAGRAYASGVYDLSCDTADRWRLARTFD